MSSTRTARTLALTGVTGLTGALTLVAGPAAAETQVEEPSTFTSAFTAMATPDMVVNAEGAPTAGEEGASGTFTYRINSDTEVICYDISLTGVTPPYQSPAKTATHIHEAAPGKAGPPRIALPNPEGDGGTLTSKGCLQGPFTTGIEANGADTGEGFTLAKIEADPAAFFTDTHTAAFTAGAVRGQLTEIPVGGVDTGAGGTAASSDPVNLALIALGGGAAVAAAGALVLSRRSVRR